MRPDYAAEYARLYREHWWWRAREAILLDEFRRLGLRDGDGREILDVGCGDGLFFPELSRFGAVRGIEVDEGLLDPGGPFRDRIATRPLGDPMFGDPSWRFDVITALDVLEHIDDDRAAVASMAAMLRPGGLLVATVPAFAMLWDEHDVVNHHRRRYTAEGLRRVLDGHGLEIIRLRYVFRSLFPLKLAVGRINRGRSRKVAQHALPPGPVNALARRLCVLEDRALRRLPMVPGASILAAARAPMPPSSRSRGRRSASLDRRRGGRHAGAIGSASADDRGPGM